MLPVRGEAKFTGNRPIRDTCSMLLLQSFEIFFLQTSNILLLDGRDYVGIVLSYHEIQRSVEKFCRTILYILMYKCVMYNVTKWFKCVKRT